MKLQLDGYTYYFIQILEDRLLKIYIVEPKVYFEPKFCL